MLQKLEVKWTKYFVNDIECERDAIYQTILNRELYAGRIILSKKYHFESYEQNRVERTEWGYLEYKTTTSNHSENLSAQLSMITTHLLNTMEPTSETYKELIHKMIHAVDMFFEAENNHAQYSQQFRHALRDFLSFLNKYTVQSDASYNDFFSKLSIEYAIFLFDMLAFGISEGNDSNQRSLPSLEFDFSGLKVNWDEKVDNDQKAQFLTEYLSILLQQTDVFLSLWQKSDAFDDVAKHKIKNLFEEFKQVIRGFQNQKKWLDTSLPTVLKNMYSFFNQSQAKSEIDKQDIPSFSRNCTINSSYSTL
ncbi:hypothetical protein Lsai_3463 [Legionella sainthelensi]|uniref:Uncharacterized protein n=1 Tax=Legionella sainthelensi TaxID=28087 RepID=A0A0W0YCG6_9GAMM|nr:hypothetical protein [Legionella sainthelensi]KTD54641.1 hypothetical protein Lsai_3463 [Legionella sainthelensi]VEH30320.1 Uncharacterised protein [Legionella sainthelensi]